ncbi:ScbA/BarX family gamma-butyrolactone biosynthesis protein [Agromyces sp. NPDC060279]|uniref:ScbA/BarX family gamma-butyrolactone biosynthesis protein n=1 Tax=Agromyces sp. NPDC060279 TaxID=3347092 RepID=UPI003659BAA5
MLSFDQAVPRRLVHRSSTSEVLPTDFVRWGEHEYIAALQWPRRHGYFEAELPGSALVTETVRQLTILACHEGFGVPLGHRFLMTGLGFALLRRPLAARAGSAAELHATVRATRLVRTPGGAFRSARFEISIAEPTGGTVASGHGDALVVAPAAYTRLRGERAGTTPPLRRRGPLAPPAAVGRQDEQDVLLVRGDGLLVLDVDRRHPVFSDHLLDHTPGAALIEACRQAARLETADPQLEFTAFEGDFRRIVEFDPPATVHATVRGERADVEIRQGRRVAMRGEATLASARVPASR